MAGGGIPSELLFGNPWIGLGSVLACLGLWLVLRNVFSSSQSIPYPPGPRALPLIGNAHEMPTKHPWIKYTEWAKTYGDVVGVKILGKRLVIFNSYQAAKEVLDKKSSIFSSRPRLPLVDMNSDWSLSLLLLPYGSDFQTSRKFMNSAVNPNAVREAQPAIQEQARVMLYRLWKEGPQFHQHNLLMQGSVILKLAYGHEVLGHDDEWIQVSERGGESMEDLGTVGGHPVDLFPILGKLPLWVWGSKFPKTMQSVKDSGINMHVKTYETVKDRHAKGLAAPSMATRLIDENMQKDGSVANEQAIAWSAGSIYSAGSDTTTSTLDFFLIAMLLYPEAQKKAQVELDKVLQHERLPTFEEMESLPYITAIVKETLRWRPVSPAGFPHLSTQDITYNGMFIPAGTMAIWNSWYILHDPKEYSYPEQFYPEHFVVPAEKQPLDPEDVIFGFGRRVCPGRHLARSSLWIAVASLLTLFDISCPLDEEGKPTKPDTDYIDGLVSHPKPCKAVFKPRSDGYLKALMQERESKGV